LHAEVEGVIRWLDKRVVDSKRQREEEKDNDKEEVKVNMELDGSG
jgi:hypothetical protein